MFFSTFFRNDGVIETFPTFEQEVGHLLLCFFSCGVCLQVPAWRSLLSHFLWCFFFIHSFTLALFCHRGSLVVRGITHFALNTVISRFIEMLRDAVEPAETLILEP